MAKDMKARSGKRAIEAQARYNLATTKYATELAFVPEYFQGIIGKKQVTTLLALLAVVVQRVSVRSQAVGSCLADQMGVQAASGRNRWTRFLRNPRVDPLDFLRAGIRFHAAGMRTLPVIIDWTEWAGDYRYLVVSVPVGTRGIPIYVRGLSLPCEVGLQNEVENEVVAEVMTAAAACGVNVLFLADRGFRRRSLLGRLGGRGSSFVVRLCGKQLIGRKDSDVLLKDSIEEGRTLDFGWVWLGGGKKNRLNVRVVATWSQGQKEPWLLATNLNAPVAEVVSLYDRRFAGIEHAFRDTKGNRFGLQMEWGQVANGHKLELLFCLVGLALLTWTAVGAHAQEADPTRSFSSTTKGPGSSLAHIGQERCRNRALPHVNSRFLKHHLPDVSFRIFPATTNGAAGKPKPWHESALQNILSTLSRKCGNPDMRSGRELAGSRSS